MSDPYEIFEEINQSLKARFDSVSLSFNLIGRTAIELAGLPERGTKDIDALAEAMQIKMKRGEKVSEVETFLRTEFGKGSVGDRRYGIYLDLVGKGVAWLPSKPKFIAVKQYETITVSRLSPADVCVSKTFSNFKKERERGRDRSDIIEVLEAHLCTAEEYLKRLDESFSLYEMHSEAPNVFPRVLQFVETVIIPKYCDADITLSYAIPSWMENMGRFYLSNGPIGLSCI